MLFFVCEIDDSLLSTIKSWNPMPKYLNKDKNMIQQDN